MISTREIVVRLLVALLLSGAVGAQRGFTGKAAGMRTHILVGVGAALFTRVSGYAFGAGAANANRIAAQVVTGIGFIAGAILKERGSIKGLTTAAGLWVVAALGMAAGAGLYVMGLAATVLVLLTLVGLRYVEIYVPRRALETWHVRITVPGGGRVAHVQDAIASQARTTTLIALARGQEDETHLALAVEMARRGDIVAVTERARAAGAQARAVTWQPTGDADTEAEL